MTSELRLLVDKRHCLNSNLPKQTLYLQFDQLKPLNLSLRCETELDADAFVPTFFELAVKKHPELHALVRQHFQDGELIDVAHFELALPQNIQQIKIWRAEETAQPVSVAVQYRSSKAFIFSEQSYLTRLKETNPTRLFSQFQHDLKDLNINGTLTAEQQLKNQWQALKHLILSQARLFAASVAKPEANNTHSTSPQRLSKLYSLATLAQTQQQWLDALEYWAKIVQHTNGAERQKAQLTQAELLHLLGETYLAESLWRHLALYAQEPIAEQASAQLRQHYQLQQDNFALQALAASRILKNPSATQINSLTHLRDYTRYLSYFSITYIFCV